MKGAHEAFLAMGSNEGDRLGYLRRACRRLHAHDSVDVAAASPVYSSEAHTLAPEEQAPSFLNAVIRLRTTLEPEELLTLCMTIEKEAGRRRARGKRWEPRTLDLDLLLFDNRTISTPSLKIPHPRMSERRFVLQPLADLAPERYVPSPFGKTVAELLKECEDPAALFRTAFFLAGKDAA